MKYILKYQNEDKNVLEYVDEIELNNDRKKYLKKQIDNGNEPILFCGCNEYKIPMSLTRHEPTPHFQTKSSNDRQKHYKFCKHYKDETSKNVYLPAISINDEGIEIAHISWEEDEETLEKQIDSDYKQKNNFIYNNRNRVTQGKMTFDAFIKYKNMQYFKINQYTNRVVGLEEFNNKLFGWIENSYIGKEKVRDLAKGKFVYGIVGRIEKVGSNRFRIKTEKNDIPCKKDILDKAVQKFRRTYNNLDIYKIIGKGDYHIVCYGIKDIKLKYPTCKILGFMLVNKYGLFCESLHEVKMFDLICSYIFQDELKNKYVFYKPTEPENDYQNPNFISDGVISQRGEQNKVVVEVFGRQEKEYIERKNIKISSCKGDGIFWDVFEPESWNYCAKRLKQIVNCID